MRDSKPSYGERVSRDLEVGCQVDEVWAATQWDKTEQESPQVEDEAPVGFSDLTPEPQKVQ